MWLNDEKTSDAAIDEYRESLLSSCPKHVVIDGLFDEGKLDTVIKILQLPDHWETQQHTYSALYVSAAQWQNTAQEQRFVQRDSWQRATSDNHIKNSSVNSSVSNSAQEFLLFLRSDEFMSVLSRIFKVSLTDMNVAEPDINTNYFRLGVDDIVGQHADDSPGREVCLLLYLNNNWNQGSGGELCFKSAEEEGGKPITIPPLYNRCVLFDPSSKGSEHWVKKLNTAAVKQDHRSQYGCDQYHCYQYRYNVTSWYWSE